MSKVSKDDILKAVEGMTVLELSDLVKALEEKFGVSAMPVATATPAASAEGSGELRGVGVATVASWFFKLWFWR